MKKLRCFMALAFGHTDTDAIYDAIKAALSDKVDVRRVDRINHNDDIDDKIIDELKQADLVIADLTYTRPSVYWEAGFAQGRPVPVVYTARRDHIGKKATDDALRVHFDLQMRNIIDWNAPDHGFLKTLKDRINLVTAPLLANRALSEAKEARRKQFAALSQNEQLKVSTDAAIAYFTENRFKLELARDDDSDKALHLQHRGQRLRGAIKIKEGTLQVARLWVNRALVKDELRWIRRVEGMSEFEVGNLNVGRKPPERIDLVTFLISLRRMTPRVMRETFPHASFNAEMVATMDTELLYLPSAELWKSGRRIERFPTNFIVGKDNVITNPKGTFVEKWIGQKSKKKRVGKACECQIVRRYCVVSGITDPNNIAQQIDETLNGVDEHVG